MNPVSTDKRVLVIIPAYNEEQTIGGITDVIHKTFSDFDILVVNDYSSDYTAEVIKDKPHVKTVNLPRNLGIGGAVQTGFLYSFRNNYDYTVQLDADGQHDPADIHKLLQPLIENNAEVVIGSRFCKSDFKYKAGFARSTGIKIISVACWFLIGKRVKDCTSGFRAYDKSSVEFLSRYYPVDYPEPEAIIMLGKNKFRMQEVAVPMYKRKAGKSSISFRKGTTYYMFKVILGMIMTAIRPKTRVYAKH